MASRWTHQDARRTPIERREAERNRSERVRVPIITHHLRWAPILALLYIVVAAAANRLFPAKALPTARRGRVRSIGRLFGAGGANLKRQGPADPVFDRPPIWGIAHLRRVGDGDSGVTNDGDEIAPPSEGEAR